MNFSEYLVSKKIDETAFAKAEPDVFQQWKSEFEHMHPNSFTMQKLNLINPIRRKYQLPEMSPGTTPSPSADPVSPVTSAPKQVKPIFKPKPKLN